MNSRLKFWLTNFILTNSSLIVQKLDRFANRYLCIWNCENLLKNFIKHNSTFWSIFSFPIKAHRIEEIEKERIQSMIHGKILFSWETQPDPGFPASSTLSLLLLNEVTVVPTSDRAILTSTASLTPVTICFYELKMMLLKGSPSAFTQCLLIFIPKLLCQHMKIHASSDRWNLSNKEIHGIEGGWAACQEARKRKMKIYSSVGETKKYIFFSILNVNVVYGSSNVFVNRSLVTRSWSTILFLPSLFMGRLVRTL